MFYLTKKGPKDVKFKISNSGDNWYDVHLGEDFIGQVMKTYRNEWGYILGINPYMDRESVPRHLRTGKGFASRKNATIFMLDMIGCHIGTTDDLISEKDDRAYFELFSQRIIENNRIQKTSDSELDMLIPGSLWTHHSGTQYEVICLTNSETKKPYSFPVTVVYKDESGVVWSRPASEFLKKFKPKID